MLSPPFHGALILLTLVTGETRAGARSPLPMFCRPQRGLKVRLAMLHVQFPCLGDLGGRINEKPWAMRSRENQKFKLQLFHPPCPAPLVSGYFFSTTPLPCWLWYVKSCKWFIESVLQDICKIFDKSLEKSLILFHVEQKLMRLSQIDTCSDTQIGEEISIIECDANSECCPWNVKAACLVIDSW